MANTKLGGASPSAWTVHAHFRKKAMKFAGAFRAGDPYSPGPAVHGVLDGT
ncbi:MAG: hypothetical protein N3F10_06055 [Candidatus Bathyarchaeota archaeon]|nr:hypothetical protein [Candidatus Bathyarchaeota archaeon]MCX8177840.1 hypothetical protein [Candidatus Bathyarchaeota archaeon]MDW8193622.1 hypothetical protein [Nitrososphaerota archaeon]